MMSSSPFHIAKGAVHVESDVVPDLARWLNDRRTQACVRITLAQRIGESNHHPVEDYSLGELDDVMALAQALYAVGFREANATRASLAYGVFAFRAERPEPLSRYLFRVDLGQGQGWLEPAATSTDERTELVKMLMGHTDLSARLALGHSRGILDQYERLIDQSNTHQGRLLQQAHTRIAALEAREVEALELRDKLQTFVQQREGDAAYQLKKVEHLRYGFDQLMKLAPTLVAGIVATRGYAAQAASSSGGAATRPSSPPSGMAEDLFERFASSLTLEQAAAIGQLLTPEQSDLLRQLHALSVGRNGGGQPSPDREPAETQASSAAPPAASPTPEAPASEAPAPAPAPVAATAPEAPASPSASPVKVSSPALSSEAPSNDVTPPSSTTPTPSK